MTKSWKVFRFLTRGCWSFGYSWQRDEPWWLLAVGRRPRYKRPWKKKKKCQVSRSLYPHRQIINGQEPSSRHTLMLPPTAIFTEVRKVPFSSYSRTVGLVYFSCVWPERAVHIQRSTKKKIFFFCLLLVFTLSEKEIWKHCAMLPQKFWKACESTFFFFFFSFSFFFSARLECERRSAGREGLHVASIQNGVLPHSICEYHLLSISPLRSLRIRGSRPAGRRQFAFQRRLSARKRSWMGTNSRCISPRVEPLKVAATLSPIRLKHC